MKILLLNYPSARVSGLDIHISNMANSNPFTYEAIVIDPIGGGQYGVGSQEVIARWRESLEDWLAQGNTLYVVMRHHIYLSGGISNYSWMPMIIDTSQFENNGTNVSLGQIVSTDSRLKRFLEDEQFTVTANYRLPSPISGLSIDAQLSSTKPTAMTISYQSGRIIFYHTRRTPKAYWGSLLASFQ